jgi:cell division septation protein DedD
MEQKQRLFIYDRKEMGILILLAVMVTVFAFTLGVHLGKKVEIHQAGVAADPNAPVPLAATAPDELPNRQDLTEQGKGAPHAADESLNQAIHDEVTRTGVRLEVKRQVDLPTDVRSPTEGATTLHSVLVTQIPAFERPAPSGKFTLQVGSYPSVADAKDQTDGLEALGLKPYLREASLKGKGVWYRIFVGGYASKEAAEKAGEQYRGQHVLESFIVAKKPE